MANKRYDICVPRKGRDDKTYWTKIGTAWEGDKGTQLVFDALPLPDGEGRCVANLFEPKPRETDGGGRRQSADADRADARGRSLSNDLDDEIPPF